jgi:hypothetical protein
MFGPIYRELQRGMWTNLNFLSMHRVCITISQLEAPLWARPDGGIPSISTGCAQARDRCAQGIHMFVHIMPVTAQRPPRSVAGRSGRAGTARATARHPVLRGEYTDGLASARGRGRCRAAGTWIRRSQGQRQYSDKRAVPYKRGVTSGVPAAVSILARSVSRPFGGELGGEVIDGVS